MNLFKHHEKKILIICDHVDSYKNGGGARTSVINFMKMFKDKFNISYISLDYLGEGSSTIDYPPEIEGVVGIYPRTKKNCIAILINWIKNGGNTTFYLNGFYSKFGSLVPLLLIKIFSIFCYVPEVVLAPRGGVSSGALAVRYFRKIIFLKALHFFGFLKNVRFHVVSEDEKNDLCNVLGENYREQCLTVANIVNANSAITGQGLKSKNTPVHLAFLARIHPIKNLNFLFDVVNNVHEEIELHIYGTIDDQNYFDKCVERFQYVDSHVHVKFCGEVLESNVVSVLSNYDLYLLPTLGENFGHTIYESLSASTPVLVSDKTPWRGEDFQSLWEFSLDNPHLWSNKINEYCNIDHNKFIKLRKNARKSATKWVNQQEYSLLYEKLFKI